MIDSRFMAHDENGIWAIATILPRKKNLLLRLKNPPKDPNNQFLTLATNKPIDVWYWDFRRFAKWAIQNNQINEEDIHNSEVIFEKYLDYLAEYYPYKLRHILEND
jgi:hypothetical protein